MKKSKLFCAIVLALSTVMLLCIFTSCGNTTGNETSGGQATEPADTTDAGNAKASDYESIKKKGKMVVGITIYAPMNYEDENGVLTGFDTEFAQAVAEKLGLTADFLIIDWDSKTFELESGSIDCVWNGMTLSDDVLNAMTCSDPYVINAQVVVMAKDNLDSYPDAESMASLKFAVESGSAGEDIAKENSFDYTAVAAQSDALLEVASGAADACIIDITMANAMTGEGTSYADLGFAVALSEEVYGVGFRKGSDMAEKVNAIFKEMKEDGTLYNLAHKYDLTLAD